MCKFETDFYNLREACREEVEKLPAEVRNPETSWWLIIILYNQKLWTSSNFLLNIFNFSIFSQSSSLNPQYEMSSHSRPGIPSRISNIRSGDNSFDTKLNLFNFKQFL